jgi:phosphate/sulfate permease
VDLTEEAALTDGCCEPPDVGPPQIGKLALLGWAMSAVRWGVAGNIVTAWVLTLPGAGLIAALSYRILHAIVRV